MFHCLWTKIRIHFLGYDCMGIVQRKVPCSEPTNMNCASRQQNTHGWCGVQGGPAKDAALDRMAQVVLCNRRRIKPLWEMFFSRVAAMCASPSAAGRTAACATFKRTVLALLATRDTAELGPVADSGALYSGGPSAVASGALPMLLQSPGVILNTPLLYASVDRLVTVSFLTCYSWERRHRNAPPPLPLLYVNCSKSSAWLPDS